MVIIGGMGNIWGVAAGAFIVYIIQAVLLKEVNTLVSYVPVFDLGPLHVDLSTINFLQFQFLLYGMALVAMMLLRPEGLFPSRVRRQELLLESDEPDDPAILGALGETPGAEEQFGESRGEGA
jgi:branched-chain amino acid transport system permease protein